VKKIKKKLKYAIINFIFQFVVLPPLTEDRSIQTIQLLTPTQQGN